MSLVELASNTDGASGYRIDRIVLMASEQLKSYRHRIQQLEGSQHSTSPKQGTGCTSTSTFQSPNQATPASTSTIDFGTTSFSHSLSDASSQALPSFGFEKPTTSVPSDEALALSKCFSDSPGIVCQYRHH
ncbi:hypothetical protein Btru_072398 [Bulinus truncatus]|nr:hypothetical protein Btru_072398 [Bulinus truncatus]